MSTTAMGMQGAGARAGRPSRPAGLLAALVAWLALALGGCVSYRHMPAAEAPVSPERQAPIPAPFALPDVPIEVDNHTPREQRNFRHEYRRLSLPSVGVNGQPENLLIADWYRGLKPGPRPAVIVLPIWGASDYPSDVITSGLIRRHGGRLDVIRVRGEARIMDWDELKDAADPEEFEQIVGRMTERMRTQVLDLRRLIRWADEHEEIDGARIGIVGFSIGGIVGGMLMVGEPAIERAVLAMGGANMGEIIAHCGGLRGELREEILPRFGWSRERYADFFSEAFAYLDPASYPGRVDPGRVLIIDALYDDCIPETARDSLWQAMGRPERISYRYSHRRAFYAMTPLGFNNMRYKIYRFLDPLLEDPGR